MSKTAKPRKTKRKTPKPHHRKGRARGKGRYGRPTYNQAQKIIALFGGEAAMAKILGLSRITVYRWGYARPLGTDGIIPSWHYDAINKAARIYGILILEHHWRPERIVYPDQPLVPGRTPYAKPTTAKELPDGRIDPLGRHRG